MHYSLRDGVSFCEVEGRLFFLDIDADRYFALSAAAEASLRQLMMGDPLDDATDCRLAGLIDRDILRTGPAPGRPITLCAPPPAATRSLLDSEGPPASLIATLRAIAAIAASKSRLQCTSLRHNLMAAVAHRRAAAGSPPPASPGACTLRRIAAAFDRAGQFVSAHDRCLAQSLAVARCVSAEGGWAQVILGVTLGPFSAHCWVQSGAELVNDRVDRVIAYTPILVI